MEVVGVGADQDVAVAKYDVSSILYPSFNSALDGMSTDIYFQGCKFNCEGCHNPALKGFGEGNYTAGQLVMIIKEKSAGIITLMGGEPLHRPHMGYLLGLLKGLHRPLSLFTGYELDGIEPGILKLLDYVKTGKYDCNSKTPVGSFLASSNQVFWKKDGCGKWVVHWSTQKGCEQIERNI